MTSSARISLVWLSMLFGLAWPANAQFKAVPVPPMPAMPFAVPTPMPAPNLGSTTPMLPNSTPPSIAAPATPASPPAAAVQETPAPTAVVPACPNRPDCPPGANGEGPLSEAAKEILKEFAKCEAEGKSVEACLSEEPPPPQLSELSFEGLSRLRECLGSSDLAATKDRWNSCVAFVP